MKIISTFLILLLLQTSISLAVATNKNTPRATFEVITLVSDGKKAKEVKSTLNFSEVAFKATDKKTGLVIKEFNYTDVKVADYSFAKKPLVSTTGAVVGTILLGPLFLVTLFIKKKQHWLSIRTENDYIVMKLDKDDFRQILNEFEIRKVTVNTVNEDEETKKDKKDK